MSAQYTCFGNGTSCQSALQIFQPSALKNVGAWGSFTSGADSVLVAWNGQSNANPLYVFRWMPSSGCFGNGSTCGAVAQTIGTSLSTGVYVVHMQSGGETYVTVMLDSVVYVYRWMTSAHCLGNGSSCGSPVSSASHPSGRVTGASVFQVGSETFLAANFWTYANNATGGYSANGIYKWNASSLCWGTGSACGSPLQTISTASDAREGSISGYAIGSEGYLAIGEYNGSNVWFFKWLPAQQCFGNGTSCGSPIQTFALSAFAGFTDFEVFTIGTGSYMTTSAYVSSQQNMYTWMPSSSCWGNGTTCGTAARSLSGGKYTWKHFSTPNAEYLVGGDMSGSRLYRWQPSQQCFGNGTSCGTSLQSFNPGGGTPQILALDIFERDGLVHLAAGGFATSSIYVITENVEPNAAAVSGPDTAYRSQPAAFVISGTDPQSDTIRYQIDWDKNGTVDEYLPATGYVPSGTQLSVSHTWSSTGTKNFQVRTQDQYGLLSGWTPASVVVSYPLPTVLLTASSGSYTQGGSPVTLTWSSSNATSCTGTGFSVSGTSGTRSVSPTQTTTCTVTCTGAGGSASDSKTVTYVCTPSNICSSGNVVNSCTGALVQSCSYLCSAGSCLTPPPPSYTSFTATDASGASFAATGRLTIRPSLVRPGATARVYWNVSDVSSCAVTGDNSDSWTGGSSGTAGKTTAPIDRVTTYTLSCTGLDGSAIGEKATVKIAPAWHEL